MIYGIFYVVLFFGNLFSNFLLLVFYTIDLCLLTSYFEALIN